MFPTIAISKHQGLISSPSRDEKIVSNQKEVIDSCIKKINHQHPYALEGSKSMWEASSIVLRDGDPYCYENFTYALSRVLGYITCI